MMKQQHASNNGKSDISKDRLPHPEEGATESSDFSADLPAEVPAAGESMIAKRAPRRGVFRAFSMDAFGSALLKGNHSQRRGRTITSPAEQPEEATISQDNAEKALNTPTATSSSLLQKSKPRPSLNRGGAIQLPGQEVTKKGSYLFESTKDLMAEYEKIASGEDNDVTIVKQQRRRASMITSQDFLLYDQIVA